MAKINWKRESGYDAESLTAKEVRQWIKRCRDDLRDIEYAIRTGDLAMMKEYADDLGGAGCELSNIAETTLEAEAE